MPELPECERARRELEKFVLEVEVSFNLKLEIVDR